jgi:Bacterial regulatory protein, Fis family
MPRASPTRILVNAMVQELGGPERAAEKLRLRGVSPMVVAIEAAGGVAKVAEALGISRGALYSRLREWAADDWPHRELRKVSEMSRVSIATLTASASDEPDSAPKRR